MGVGVGVVIFLFGQKESCKSVQVVKNCYSKTKKCETLSLVVLETPRQELSPCLALSLLYPAFVHVVEVYINECPLSKVGLRQDDVEKDVDFIYRNPAEQSVRSAMDIQHTLEILS